MNKLIQVTDPDYALRFKLVNLYNHTFMRLEQIENYDNGFLYYNW